MTTDQKWKKLVIIGAKIETTEIINLLKEFEDVFARDYKDLKGLVKEMGEMNIDIKLEARPIKKRPYKLAHKYKKIVKKEIDNMLTAGIIYPIDHLEWEAQWSSNQKSTTRQS